MSDALRFLTDLSHTPEIQAELMTHPDPFVFETVQKVAAQHDYHFTVDELNQALAGSPELVAQLQTLAASREMALDEAEMSLISGGGVSANKDSDY